MNPNQTHEIHHDIHPYTTVPTVVILLEFNQMKTEVSDITTGMFTSILTSRKSVRGLLQTSQEAYKLINTKASYN